MSSSQEAIAAGVVAGSIIMVFLIAIALWVLFIIARWKIFTKAGEKGWKSIIPFYAEYVQWRIGWKRTGLFWVTVALVVIGFICGSAGGSFTVDAYGNLVSTGHAGALGIIGSIAIIAGFVLDYISVYKLFKSFGKGVGWFIGYIFVPNIMLLVLGFGSASYIGAQD